MPVKETTVVRYVSFSPVLQQSLTPYLNRRRSALRIVHLTQNGATRSTYHQRQLHHHPSGTSPSSSLLRPMLTMHFQLADAVYRRKPYVGVSERNPVAVEQVCLTSGHVEVSVAGRFENIRRYVSLPCH